MDGDVREFLAQQPAAETRLLCRLEDVEISYPASSVIFFSRRYLISLNVIYERLQTPKVVWRIASESSL